MKRVQIHAKVTLTKNDKGNKNHCDGDILEAWNYAKIYLHDSDIYWNSDDWYLFLSIPFKNISISSYVENCCSPNNISGFEITLKNHCEGDYIWAYFQALKLHHSDFSLLFWTLHFLLFVIQLITRQILWAAFTKREEIFVEDVFVRRNFPKFI